MTETVQQVRYPMSLQGQGQNTAVRRREHKTVDAQWTISLFSSRGLIFDNAVLPLNWRLLL